MDVSRCSLDNNGQVAVRWQLTRQMGSATRHSLVMSRTSSIIEGNMHTLAGKGKNLAEGMIMHLRLICGPPVTPQAASQLTHGGHASCQHPIFKLPAMAG
jgi:hypothetical protein